MLAYAAQANAIDFLDYFIKSLPFRIREVRTDKAPEFVAKTVQDWIAAVGARTAFIEPGSPWEKVRG
jgi:putative transposase